MRLAMTRALALLAAACLPCFAQAQADSATEGRLKTAFLYNFSQYIEWPSHAFAQADTPFQVCVLGRDTLGSSLQALESRSYKSHPIVVSHPASPRAARSCHIVYFEMASTTPQARELAQTLGDAPVLVVSSDPEALAMGASIGFIPLNGKLRWTLNLAATRKAQLKVSVKLVEIALTVVGEAAQ